MNCGRQFFKTQALIIFLDYYYRYYHRMYGEKVKIALVVASYFIVSISMVLMNKFLLAKEESIPAPFFVTWYGKRFVCSSEGTSAF